MLPTGLLLLLLSGVTISYGKMLSVPKTTNCQNCAEIKADKINVHIIAHSHNDIGWLETFDQYYYGLNLPDGRGPGVQYILSSVVNALLHHPNRTFVQAETAFFWKWWKNQNNETRTNLKKLVNSGQFEIVGGGMVMNDEATTNYQSIIDQFTWGLRILNDTLGNCGRPKVGWQIDSFGHSREQANIFAEMGYQGVVLERLDVNDKTQRLKHNLEFEWKTSEDFDRKIFATMFPNTRNSDPQFCFDILCSIGSINDDAESPDYNLAKIHDDFETKMLAYKIFYQTNNLMIPMGGDFHYQAAEVNYANLDKLIKSFSDHQQFNVFYSTPSCYLKAVKSEIINKNTTPIKIDDFLPISTDDHSFWTGYFSSRANFKNFAKIGNTILQSCKQLFTLGRLENIDKDIYMQELREVMGIILHHDAITGTSKQNVTNDFVRMLGRAIAKVVTPLNEIISYLLNKNNNTDTNTEQLEQLSLELCLLSNVSICKSSKQDRFTVVVHNPLGQPVDFYVRLPVDGTKFTITGPDGIEIYEIFNKIHQFNYIDEDIRPGTYDLVFLSRNIPPFGLKLYYIEKIKGQFWVPILEPTKNDSFGNNVIGFNITDCKLSSVTIQYQTIKIEQELLFYKSGSIQNGHQNSGAYIFRPLEPAKKFPEPIKCYKTEGILVDEFLQVYNDNTKQIIRLYKNEYYLEFDWIVGDLDNKQNGVEVISRFFVKNFNNNNTFYTDSNGRQLLKRVLNQRPTYSYNSKLEPISSNYYPITSQILIRDEEKQLEITILTDRAQGGSSLNKGEIELMIYRRLNRDDGFGINETLNEIEYRKGVFVRGQHWLVFGMMNKTFLGNLTLQGYEKNLVMRKHMQPVVFVGGIDASLQKMRDLFEFKYEVLMNNLPENVNLLTFEPWLNGYLIRLEHIYSKNDGKQLSKTTNVNLKNLFQTFDIIGIRETNLAANVWLKDDDKHIFCPNIKECSSNILLIKLEPMQIRTFVVITNKNNIGGKIWDREDDDQLDNFGVKNGQIYGIVFILIEIALIYELVL